MHIMDTMPSIHGVVIVQCFVSRIRRVPAKKIPSVRLIVVLQSVEC